LERGKTACRKSLRLQGIVAGFRAPGSPGGRNATPSGLACTLTPCRASISRDSHIFERT